MESPIGYLPAHSLDYRPEAFHAKTKNLGNNFQAQDKLRVGDPPARTEVQSGKRPEALPVSQ